MNAHTAKRKRRQANMRLRSRGKFKVRHKGRSGRTGSMWSKHNHAKAPLSVRAGKIVPGFRRKPFRRKARMKGRSDMPKMTPKEKVVEAAMAWWRAQAKRDRIEANAALFHACKQYAVIDAAKRLKGR